MSIPDNQPQFNIEDSSTWVVLVVEDNDDNRELAVQLLSDYYQATVHEAAGGQQAIDMLAEGLRPSFVLLDLEMPEVSGWMVQREMRQNPAYDHIPIIALSAHATRRHRERAVLQGFDGFIAKPYMLTTLRRDIQKCLRNEN